MIDMTTITPEERARLRSVLSEHGNPQVEDRIILRLLNTIEQAEPRSLTWTHEPPKVAGWYWMRQQGESFDLIQHYNQADIDGGFDNEKRLKQWAGPIAPPVEG